jgi:putative ABC transport system substrate-binding protein
MVLTELAAKALQILKDTLPQAKQIGVLWNPTTPSHAVVLKEVESADRSLGVQLLSMPIESVADFDRAFAKMARERADGFLVPGSPLTNIHRTPLVDLELKYRLPGIFGNKANMEAGGFMSYGADFNYM